MTTRFGKWLETEGFAKCFNVVILLAIGLDTLMTGLAGWERCQSSIWTGVWGNDIHPGNDRLYAKMDH